MSSTKKGFSLFYEERKKVVGPGPEGLKKFRAACLEEWRALEDKASYFPGRKVKRPRSAYAFFTSAVREQVAHIRDFSERSAAVAKMWRELEDKSAYTRLSAEDRKRFEREKEEEAERSVTESLKQLSLVP